MQVVTRFAPSPTGHLHLGHAWSALQAHDFARARGGAFLLRIEDIDPGRARPAHVNAIFQDLLWLGLKWDDEIVYQSERLELYALGLQRLEKAELVYPCFCTRAEIAAEIAASASAPHKQDKAIYPGICRNLSAAERKARMASDPHAWRLDVARASATASGCSGPLGWFEGEQEKAAVPQSHGDVVLARKDAPASYHLAVTVDDAAQGVTDVVRGRDLESSTHVHRLLQALLDLPTPTYHHHDLLIDDRGRRLAKRDGSRSLAELRASGIDPAALIEAMRSRRPPFGYRLETR